MPAFKQRGLKERHNMPSRVHVCIRGLTFISISEAARYFGLHRGTICHALDRGTLDTVGLGVNWATKQPVWLNGVRYESQTACAEAVGTGSSTVRNAVKRAKQKKLTFIDFRYGRLTWSEPVAQAA